MSITKNLKDPIGDVLGLIIMCSFLFAVYKGSMQFVWEGLIGVGIGAMFFFLPDQVIIDFFKALINKLLTLVGANKN